jgi:hypothetical protein
MLVVGQLPMADVRSFVEQDTHRDTRPEWANSLLAARESSFVRNVGGLKQRQGSGDISWENEGIYCDARHAVRLPLDLPRYQFGPAANPIAAFKGSTKEGSRRYYVFEPVVRFEIGLSRIWGPHKLAGRQLSDFLESMLNFPLDIKDASGITTQRLRDAGPSLAAHALVSTTRRVANPAFSPELWWMTPGQPMLFVEYHVGEMADPPKTGHRVFLPDEYGLDLYHWRSSVGGQVVQAWLLRRTRDSDRDAMRQIRIHLMRLHAELECFIQVLRLTRNQLSPKVGTPQAAAMKKYLERLQRLLDKQTVYGHPQEPILQEALAAIDYVNPDDWPAVEPALGGLIQKISKVQKQLRVE